LLPMPLHTCCWQPLAASSACRSLLLQQPLLLMRLALLLPAEQL
jgi:hypothetical protein